MLLSLRRFHLSGLWNHFPDIDLVHRNQILERQGYFDRITNKFDDHKSYSAKHKWFKGLSIWIALGGGEESLLWSEQNHLDRMSVEEVGWRHCMWNRMYRGNNWGVSKVWCTHSNIWVLFMVFQIVEVSISIPCVFINLTWENKAYALIWTLVPKHESCERVSDLIIFVVWWFWVYCSDCWTWIHPGVYFSLIKLLPNMFLTFWVEVSSTRENPLSHSGNIDPPHWYQNQSISLRREHKTLVQLWLCQSVCMFLG